MVFIQQALGIRVTCIGDSIKAEGAPVTYCDKLSELLGSGYEVYNGGCSGHTMFKDGLEMDGSPSSYWTTQQWLDAQSSSPDIVTIMLGTKDSKLINWSDDSRASYYLIDYADMVNIVQSLPTKPKVFAMIPPPLFSPYPYTMQPDVINTTLPMFIPTMSVEIIDNWYILWALT